MNKTSTKRDMILPAMLFAFIMFLSYNLQWHTAGIYILSDVMAALLLTVFASLTCLFLVVKKNKATGYVWFNYVIWATLLILPQIQ